MAQNHLAFHYDLGLGVPKSHELGQLIGFLYDNGQGVPKNHAKAVYWFKHAAAQGNEAARQALQRAESEYGDQQRGRSKP